MRPVARAHLMQWFGTLFSAAWIGVSASLGIWWDAPIFAALAWFQWRNGEKMVFTARNLEALDVSKALLDRARITPDPIQSREYLAQAQAIIRAVEDTPDPGWLPWKGRA